MVLFDWKEEYSVKIDIIDTQHKVLVKWMNEFYEHHQKGDFADANNCLTGLVKYTVLHFEDEEKMMSQRGYPHFASHKKGHDILLGQIENLRRRYVENSSASNGEELAQFLKRWLAGHIMGSDQQYSQYLSGKGLLAKGALMG